MSRIRLQKVELEAWKRPETINNEKACGEYMGYMSKALGKYLCRLCMLDFPSRDRNDEES